MEKSIFISLYKPLDSNWDQDGGGGGLSIGF